MMYHLRRNIFPAEATHTPPFRSRGMTGNHPLNHTPSTWNVDGGFPREIFYQIVRNLSNKRTSPHHAKNGQSKDCPFSFFWIIIQIWNYLIIFAKFQKSCWYINVFLSHAYFTTQQLLNAYCFCTSAIFRTHDSTPHTTQHFTAGFQLWQPHCLCRSLWCAYNVESWSNSNAPLPVEQIAVQDPSWNRVSRMYVCIHAE